VVLTKNANIVDPPTRPPQEDCSHEEFRCNNGQCIDSRLYCDREYHCNDGSDELYCGMSTVLFYRSLLNLTMSDLNFSLG